MPKIRKLVFTYMTVNAFHLENTELTFNPLRLAEAFDFPIRHLHKIRSIILPLNNHFHDRGQLCLAKINACNLAPLFKTMWLKVS